MRRLPRTPGRRHRDRHRPADDPFDYWLDLVVELIIEPFFDLLRFAWDMLRGVWVQTRSGRRKRSPRTGHRRHREGGRP